jgi:transcription-repair coupling factor (superfamily II helicase)
MHDRFGPVPPEVEDLFTTVRARKIAVELGFERMFLKNDTLKCFFVSNPDSPYFQSEVFNGILTFLQKTTNKAKLKQVGKNGILVIEGITTMNELFFFLNKMHSAAIKTEVSTSKVLS